MKVLFIGPIPPPMTGQALACRVILDELSRAHQVEVVNLSKRDFRQGFSSFARATEVGGILWRALWRSRGADVVYLTVSESRAGNLKDLCLYLIAAGRLNRLVIHLLGGANMRQLLQPGAGLIARANAAFLRRLGGAIVEGETQAAIYRPFLPSGRIHVRPNFAEDELFSTSEEIDRNFAERRRLRVLFLSNLLPGKGHAELVAAVASLDDASRSALEVDIAGGFESDDHRAAFLRSIAGVPEIRYHGTVDGAKKRELLARAHVFCLPTYYPYEGQPISLIEAYAAGCAVITTNHSGIRDVFCPGENGYEVSKKSVPDLAAAIHTALGAPDVLRRMAHTNLARAVGRHRRSRYAAEVVGILEAIGRAA